MTHLSYHINYTVFFALPHGARARSRSSPNSLPMSLLLSVHCMLRGVSMNRIDWELIFRYGIQMSEYLFKHSQREKNRWWCVKNVQIWLNGNCASNCMWCERHCEWMRQWSNAILKRNQWVFHVIFLRFQFLSISQSLRSNQKGQWLKRKLKSTSEGNEHAEKKTICYWRIEEGKAFRLHTKPHTITALNWNWWIVCCNYNLQSAYIYKIAWLWR